MKAMIFAAGLGTRLQPDTNNLPKALVKINDKTLLEIAIENLTRNGFNEIIINVHHFAGQVINFINSHSFNADLHISDESDSLLDTGGGLKKVAWFFKNHNPFLLYNVDILSNLDLKKFYNHTLKSNCIASLAVRKRKSDRFLLFDDNNFLCGWKNIKTGQIIKKKPGTNLTELAFSGIHFVNPKIFDLMPDKEIFSMIDLYLEIMEEQKIEGYVENNSLWMDVGRLESLKSAKQIYNKFFPSK